MKVIFLDIDGVLNTSNSYTVSSNLQLPIDNFRLNYLRYIVEKTDAKIVLSSSFRHFFQKENNVMVPKTLKGKKLYDKREDLKKASDLAYMKKSTKEY